MTLQELLNEEREEGRNEGRLSLLSQLINNGVLTIEQAARMTNLSVEEIQLAMKTFEGDYIE